MRLTKQGVRDLNPPGHNGHRNHGAKCRHFYVRAVIDRRWEYDPDYCESYLEDVIGRKCIHCGRSAP